MKNDEDTTSDMSITTGLLLCTMVFAGQASVIITTSVFYIILALKFFLYMTEENFYFRFMLLVSFKETTLHVSSV